jgi:copper chaperone CopZ
MMGMRLAILLLASTLGASAEFRQVTVDLEGVDCAACLESLPGRLERVRGMETVGIDVDLRRVTMRLAAGNEVRLAPLLARLTQGGTKIRRVETVVRGAITRQDDKLAFQPAGLAETYRLQPAENASLLRPQDEVLYEIRGYVSGIEPGAEPVLEAKSIEAVAAER